MATKQKSITMDDETKGIFKKALDEKGVSASHAIRILAREYRDRGFVFIETKQKEKEKPVI